MAEKPEEKARAAIDQLLANAGWTVQSVAVANLHAACGVAIEFPLKTGHGFADYMLYIDGKAAGVLEAKKEGFTLSGVEIQLDEDFDYDPDQLDRDVVAVDQIRTIVRTFRDKLATEIFPNRTEVPKTLVFAKDDSHAEDIVRILREEFGKGNDFAQKITYRTTGAKPEDLIASFRNSYFPRIAVTVDMIATGTDIKPLECVLFMRAVKSRTFFEQMKGRGVRVISPDDLQAVTPDAKAKDHFVIVDAVGVCERDKKRGDSGADATKAGKQLSQRYASQEQRYDLFRTAIERANRSLYTIVREVGLQGQDACPTAWMTDMDARGSLAGYFAPPLTDLERATADCEGWILGVM